MVETSKVKYYFTYFLLCSHFIQINKTWWLQCTPRLATCMANYIRWSLNFPKPWWIMKEQINLKITDRLRRKSRLSSLLASEPRTDVAGKRMRVGVKGKESIPAFNYPIELKCFCLYNSVAFNHLYYGHDKI